MVRFLAIVSNVRKLVNIVEKERKTSINYNFGEIKFDDEDLDHIKNPDVKCSERVILKCPECSIYTTAGYSTLSDFMKKGNGYCINEKCKFFLKNKKLGTFDVKRILSERRQTLLTKKYTNSRDLLEVKCDVCGNEQDICFLDFMKGNACSKSDCECNRLRINKETGEVYKKENRMSEKNIDYEYDFKINGYTLRNKVKTEEDEANLICSEGHEFTSKYVVLKKCLEGKRNKLFCDICEIERRRKVKKPVKPKKIVILFESEEETEESEEDE